MYNSPNFLQDNIRYIQPNFLRATFYLRIVKASGEAIGNDADVSLVDFYGQAFINRIELRVNNRQVLDGGGFNYHTKVLLNTLLNYDKTATTTHLRSSGFWADRDDANALTAADSIGADYEMQVAASARACGAAGLSRWDGAARASPGGRGPPRR